MLPRNVQKDPETSLTWELKDELIQRGKVYYAKLARGKTMFLAPRMIPYFHAVWGMRRAEEKRRLSKHAQAILKVLRKEWEMASSDLREEAGVKDRATFTKAMDELQAAMIVVPSAAVYEPKFTYIWELAVGRFPDALVRRVNRETAVREIARCFLAGAGMTIPGELARVTGLSRPGSRAWQPCAGGGRVRDAARARSVPIGWATAQLEALAPRLPIRMMRKAAAGLLIGMCAAAIVLALTNIEAFRTVELKTYDWRLARTADPSTARKDIALIEIDEYSLRNLQQHAGRWPWPRVVHASLIEYLNRGKPTLIVYDVLFADEDLRVGFPYGGDTWSGPESDKALADTIKKAGNVILLADATFVGETTDKQTLPDQGYRLNVPGVLERRVVFPPAGPLSGAAAALGHNFLSLDADGPVRHVVPFVRTGENAMPSLGLSAALRAAGINPSTVRIDGTIADRRATG